MNPVLAYMKCNNIPLTRENYLALAFPTRDPSPEEEGMIPEQFRRNEFDLRVHAYVNGVEEEENDGPHR